MRILLTNDDGIRAPGIIALHDALAAADPAGPLGAPGGRMGAPGGARAGGASDRSSGPGGVHDARRVEVMTVAPATVQSATSHGVTFHEPLMVRPQRVTPRLTGLAVDGRPADCVKLAVSQLWPERFGPGSRPDLVVSGMNMGANCGINVIYSGTVGAAIEAAFLGVPSIAVSLHLGPGRAMYDVAARWAREVIERVVASGVLEAHACININIPRVEEPAEGGGARGAAQPVPDRREAADPRPDLVASMACPPVVVCAMNTHGLVDQYERRMSPGGEVYYWASGHGLDFHATDPDTDVDALVARGCVTVTPLRYDLTDRATLERLRGAMG
ncbi:MAG: 5'/3'-nucleotidase SurE [Phycisphaerales bacterium]|jgi:5'-nucleotidase|nr:5'/3'-nucleotidase SurE [Phycisphaerales bacterium]